MKKATRLAALFFAIALAATGCTSGETSTSSTTASSAAPSSTAGESTAEVAEEKEHITITMMNRVSLPYTLEDNPVIAEIERINNITLMPTEQPKIPHHNRKKQDNMV